MNIHYGVLSFLMPFKKHIHMANNVDQEISELLKEMGAKTETTESNGFQAPIKDTWYSSGGFSTTKTDARHEHGHKAIDMRALAGTPIYPLSAGVVINVGSSSVGGNFVKIQHNKELSSYYAHMSTVKVHEGDHVDLNTIIGTVGATGSAKDTFPHLHLEVYKNGMNIDPTAAGYFSGKPYTDPRKNPEEAEYISNYWTSDEAKAAAKSFNMTQHKAKKPVFSSRVDDILKLASEFDLLSRY